MDYQQYTRTNGPASPYSGNTTPGENIELIRPPQSNMPSPASYPHDPKGPVIYQNAQEAAPYYDNYSQHDLVRPEADPPCKSTPWKPGILRQFPFTGFGALLLSFLCMVGALAVLITSNQKPVADWKVQPTVILAILSAVFNFSLAFALSRGVGISWWHQALSGGTVADLSRRWSYGNSAKAALLSGRHFNRIALASLLVLLTFSEGPLLQRASTVVSKTVTTKTPLSTSLAPLLPQGYTAGIGAAGNNGAISPKLITPDFAKVLSDYQRNVPITTGITDCTGNCSTVVQAAGLNVQCGAPKPRPFTPDALSKDNQEMFTVNVAWSLVNCTDEKGGTCPTNQVVGGAENLQLEVAYVQPVKGNSCLGYYVSTTCNISHAVVEYNIKMDGKTITLDNPSQKLKAVALSNEIVPVGMTLSILAGLDLMAQQQFASAVTWDFVVEGGWQIDDLTVFPSQHLLSGDASNPGSCLGNLTWSDPTDDILSAFNELMFRSAVKSAGSKTSTYNLQSPNQGANKTFSTPSTVDATQTSTQNIYQTRFAFLIAAAAVMTAGILAVIPTFYGWWDIGRDCSLDPIEIAKAFDAPILGGSTALSNADSSTLIKTIGKRRIVYGEQLQADINGERKLTMGILGPRGVS